MSLPRTVTADILQEEKFVIVVTEENIIHLDESPVTIAELKEILFKEKESIDSILIKADVSASLGKIIEIWDICRDLGVLKLNIATLQAKER